MQRRGCSEIRRLEMAGSRWEPEVEMERVKKKIGWEMRDCTEPKSRPAGPACCLRDCKLSLRMQTDKQDRHHLPILPSTTETVAHASPFCSPSFSILHSTSSRFFSFSPMHMHVSELPNLLWIKWVSLQYTFPSHCSMVRWFSIGGKECLGSVPCFTSVIVYIDTMSSHFSYRILLDSQRGTWSPQTFSSYS